jgi:hypothetical protein
MLTLRGRAGRCAQARHLLLAVGTLLSGCGSAQDDSSAATSAAATSGTGGGGSTSCEPSGAPDVPDVSGRFALEQVTSQIVVLPGFADPFHTRVVSVLLGDQTQNGETVALSAAYCDHHAEDPDLIVHVIIPDAYTASLAPVMRSGTYAKGPSGYRYHLPKHYELEGVVLDDPVNDALPVDPADPRVVDQDGDGKPGMTLRLTGLIDGEIYSVQRGFTELDGGPLDADAFEGTITFASDQVVVASDPASLKDQEQSSSVDTAPCSSYFRMARVPDGSDCAYVMSQVETLFP